MNTDVEEDECNFIWEVDRDWTKKYFRRNNIVLNKNAPIAVDELGNHRRQRLCEGEFLIVWKNGIRDWTLMSIAYEIDQKMKKLISNYLLENNLTKQIMEKSLILDHIDEIKGTKESEMMLDKDKEVSIEVEKTDNGKLLNGSRS